MYLHLKDLHCPGPHRVVRWTPADTNPGPGNWYECVMGCHTEQEMRVIQGSLIQQLSVINQRSPCDSRSGDCGVLVRKMLQMWAVAGFCFLSRVTLADDTLCTSAGSWTSVESLQWPGGWST